MQQCCAKSCCKVIFGVTHALAWKGPVTWGKPSNEVCFPGTGEDGYGIVRLPSGEQRSVLLGCKATIGTVSNPQHKNRKIGKAGAKRWMGRRPVTRGVAMNPVDHPHGGGRSAPVCCLRQQVNLTSRSCTCCSIFSSGGHVPSLRLDWHSECVNADGCGQGKAQGPHFADTLGQAHQRLQDTQQRAHRSVYSP